MSEPEAFVLTNARIVLADRVIERGWVAVEDGAIAEIGEGERARARRGLRRRPACCRA